jgi:hypothetical protein
MRSILFDEGKSSTYDRRTLKTRLPVRSALFKQRTGGLVVRWVTTSEYPLLYVFCSSFASFVQPRSNKQIFCLDRELFM